MTLCIVLCCTWASVILVHVFARALLLLIQRYSRWFPIHTRLRDIYLRQPVCHCGDLVQDHTGMGSCNYAVEMEPPRSSWSLRRDG